MCALAGAQDPPLSVVRKFAHLLEQSNLDLQEEQEVIHLREEVVTKIRSNQQMEKDLNLMDIKIGLLVKNRITLQVWTNYKRNLTFFPWVYIIVSCENYVSEKKNFKVRTERVNNTLGSLSIDTWEHCLSFENKNPIIAMYTI